MVGIRGCVFETPRSFTCLRLRADEKEPKKKRSASMLTDTDRRVSELSARSVVTAGRCKADGEQNRKPSPQSASGESAWPRLCRRGVAPRLREGARSRWKWNRFMKPSMSSQNHQPIPVEGSLCAFDDRTPVAQDRVVAKLQRHIRFRVVGSPDHPCRAIELPERQEATAPFCVGYRSSRRRAKATKSCPKVTRQKMVSCDSQYRTARISRAIFGLTPVRSCVRKLISSVLVISTRAELPPKIEPSRSCNGRQTRRPGRGG